MKVVYLALFLLLSTFLHSQITYQDAFPNLRFRFPVEIENTGVPGDDRLFVVEQAGEIEVFDNDPNTSTKTKFLDVKNDVYYNNFPGAELGLLGLAFHPDYQNNGYFYIYYTKRNGNSRPIITVERIGTDPNNPDAANLNDRLILFEFIKNQSNTNHNGGKITFGPDGYLYVSIGDGGGAGDPQRNAQNKTNVFGKILRIDVDVDGNNPVDNNGIQPEGNYEIPSDNPLTGANERREIYAWGIRNTWKMNFDQQTNRLWAADVGQNEYEEINLIENGGNYGWSRYEANDVYNSSVSAPNPIFPIYFYDHDQGDVSITGGYVYRGSQVSSTNPSLFGKYLFADYSSGRVWILDYDPSTGNSSRTFLFRASGINVSCFGEDLSQEMYFADYTTSGAIYQLVDGTTSGNADAVAGVGEWCDSPSGTDGIIYALAEDDGDLYVGGEFLMAGGVMAENLAIWNGTTWQAFGAGTNGRVNAIAVASNGDVYVGGNFTQIDGVNANNIAKWDGSTWQALGMGTDAPVLALEIDGNDKVYVGGTFATAGSITVNNIASWNGSWSALTDAMTSVAGTGNEVRSLEVNENNLLYVGGNFGVAGGKNASRIATWNGNNWGTLGAGTSGFVQAILGTPDYIYAGGNFGLAGNMTVNRIARWNRSSLQWEKLENGLSNSVNALAEKDGYIYVGGSFMNALNDSPDPNIIVNNVARWSESDGWEALGDGTAVGLEGLVNALECQSNQLYTGGNFGYAGSPSNTVSNFACWSVVSCPNTSEVGGMNVTGTYGANLSIETANPCVVQSQAELVAGELIELKNGFHAQAGSEFIARIGACGSSNFPPLFTDNEEVIEDRTQQILSENEVSEKENSVFKIFPNPTAKLTNFQYELTTTSQVELSLYDLSGKLIQAILPAQQQDAGQYFVEFSTENLEGIYWVEVRIGERRVTKKLVILR
ncbi:MAG: PQQ-dependent sugar dehydrogenase [Bacteroidota bacterium]